MGRIFPQLIRLFLAATIVVGGIFVHMGSAAHATSSFGVPHAHSGHAEPSDVTNLAKSDARRPNSPCPLWGSLDDVGSILVEVRFTPKADPIGTRSD